MILAIDTSTQWMGIALQHDSLVLYEKVWKTNRRHTVELSPAVQSALDECGQPITNLQAIAVALGPGSFTSLRIGLAVAKGMALSLRIPVIGIPTLDIMAACQPLEDKALTAVLKAGRNRFAACDYKATENGWAADGEIFAATAAELENRITSPTIVCGEINADERKILERKWRNAFVATPAANVRRPSILAAKAQERLATEQYDDVVSLAPIYLHTLNTPAVQ